MFAFQDELNYLLGLCKLNFWRSFTALRIGIGSCVFNVFMYTFSFNFLLLLSKKNTANLIFSNFHSESGKTGMTVQLRNTWTKIRGSCRLQGDAPLIITDAINDVDLGTEESIMLSHDDEKGTILLLQLAWKEFSKHSYHQS